MVKNGQKVDRILRYIFGNFGNYRNKPSFGTDTDTENVPEYTGKNVPVFPVHFPEIIPNSETVTETHGLNNKSIRISLKEI